MTALPCPHCGALMNSPLKFCLSCGRAISKADMQKMGGLKHTIKGATTKRLEDMISSSSFGVAKRSYGFQRSSRSFLFAICIFLSLLFVIFFAWRFLSQKEAALQSSKELKVEPSPGDGHKNVIPHAVAH